MSITSLKAKSFVRCVTKLLLALIILSFRDVLVVIGFSLRAINVRSNLPQDVVDFTSLASFQCAVKLVDFSA